jgi:hypothetical protein
MSINTVSWLLHPLSKDTQQKILWNRCHGTPTGNKKLLLIAKHSIFQLLFDVAENKEVT